MKKNIPAWRRSRPRTTELFKRGIRIFTPKVRRTGRKEKYTAIYVENDDL